LWELCGDGSDLEELKRRQDELNLKNVVDIRGWTSPEELRPVHTRSHISIVPTRSNFSEGLAKSVVESVLAGRPVITSAVVPAFEVLRKACVEARTNDIDSYVDAIFRIYDDSRYYRVLCDACHDLQKQFYDPSRGLKAILKEVFSLEPL